MSNHNYLAILCMLLSMLANQVSASFAKYLFAVLDPTSITVLRLCFASLIVLFMLRSWRIYPQFKQMPWRNLILYSLSLGFMNFQFYHALALLPQGIAVGLEFVGPLGLALLSLKQKSDALWVLCAIVGVAMLMPWSSSSMLSGKGILLALGAGCCWALYIYFGQKIVQANIGLHSLTLGIGMAALFWLPVGLVNNAHGVLNPHYWGYALGLSLLATAIPYALDLYALRYLNRVTYGTITSLAPALAALLGLLLLKEYLTMMQWLALACITIASIGITVSQALRKKSAIKNTA